MNRRETDLERSLLGNIAFILLIPVHHQNEVCLRQKIQLMGDQNPGAGGQGATQQAIFNNMAAHMCINCTERVIQQNNLGVLVCCSGNADALFLTTRKVDTLLTQQCTNK